jgi:hypothetical protein
MTVADLLLPAMDLIALEALAAVNGSKASASLARIAFLESLEQGLFTTISHERQVLPEVHPVFRSIPLCDVLQSPARVRKALVAILNRVAAKLFAPLLQPRALLVPGSASSTVRELAPLPRHLVKTRQVRAAHAAVHATRGNQLLVRIPHRAETTSPVEPTSVKWLSGRVHSVTREQRELERSIMRENDTIVRCACRSARHSSLVGTRVPEKSPIAGHSLDGACFNVMHTRPILHAQLTR